MTARTRPAETLTGRRSQGLAITVAGVAILSPDALLVRLIDAGPATILFWRGTLAAVVLALLTGLVHGRGTARAWRRIGRPGLGVALAFGAGTGCFTLAVLTTLVANVLIIIATSPLFAALISRFWLGEPVAGRTWAAIGACLVGIAVTVSGHAGPAPAFGRLQLGDGIALVAALLIGTHLSILRRRRDRDMTPAVALGAGLLALASLPAASPLAVPPGDIVYLALLGGVVIPGAFALIAIGPRFLPSPEVSMVLLLETVLGTLWVWLILGETPGLAAVAGGAIVLTTLTAYFAAQRRQPHG